MAFFFVTSFMATSSRRRAAATALTGLILAGLSGTLFGWVGEEVLESDTVHFDSRVRDLVHNQAEAPLTRVMIFASQIGSTIPVVTFTLLALLIFWLRKMKREAVLFGIAILGAGALTYLLKVAFHRPRPIPYFGLPTPGDSSFPSGHSLFAVCFYLVLAHLASSRLQSAGIRVVIWSFAVIMLLLIGFSRIYLGVHYASDVVAGYAAGFVWVAAIVAVEPFISIGDAAASR